MKKTIVVIILAVYIASIAIVNFFGLEVRQFDSITYVTGIQCDTVTFHGDNSKRLYPVSYSGSNYDIPVFEFYFIPSGSAEQGGEYTLDDLSSNPNVIEINYEVIPHLATEKGVKFEYDETAGIAVFHELSGSFIFLKPGTITITIKATDGSNVSTRVRVKARVLGN